MVLNNHVKKETIDPEFSDEEGTGAGVNLSENRTENTQRVTANTGLDKSDSCRTKQVPYAPMNTGPDLSESSRYGTNRAPYAQVKTGPNLSESMTNQATFATVNTATLTGKDECSDIELLSTEYSSSNNTEFEDTRMVFPVSFVANVHDVHISGPVEESISILPPTPKDRLETAAVESGSVHSTLMHCGKSSEKQKLKEITTKKVSSEYLVYNYVNAISVYKTLGYLGSLDKCLNHPVPTVVYLVVHRIHEVMGSNPDARKACALLI